MGKKNCLQECVRYLLGRKDVPHFIRSKDWMGRLFYWLKDEGYSLTKTAKVQFSAGPYIAVGPSPYTPGEYHAVVYRNGKLLYDPNPGGLGVKRVAYCFVIGKVL